MHKIRPVIYSLTIEDDPAFADGVYQAILKSDIEPYSEATFNKGRFAIKVMAADVDQLRRIVKQIKNGRQGKKHSGESRDQYQG